MHTKKSNWGISIVATMAITIPALADISGKVYKDFNMNGTFDGGDAPVIGVPVTAVCDDGQTYNASTDGSGNYTLSGFPQGSKCRIEVDPASQGVGSGTNAPGSAPLVDIVSDGSTHNVSTGSPATYCQANPDVIMAAMPGYYTLGKYSAGGGERPDDDFGTVFKVPAPTTGEFNNNSTIASKRTTMATFGETGAIWGAAWKKGGKELFVSAALKRYVPLKNESSAAAVQTSAGTIYKIDTATNPATVSSFTVVPNVVSSAAATDLSHRDYSYNQDKNTLKYTGRMGLGDLEISEDETKLYTVNMNTKELVIINASNGNIIETVALPNPYANGECNADKVRPWALKVRGEDVFIGSVCEDQIENDIGAAIQKYNGAMIQTIAITNSLRYLRARGYKPAGRDQGDGYRYRNWTNDYADAAMLTDIEFTNSGDMVLGYNSRATYNRSGSLRGDIRKMCINPDGTYTDETTELAATTCASHITKHEDNPTDYYEFYFGDYFGRNYGGYGHPETASGALAQAPGAPNIIVGMIDATDWYQPGAIGNYDNETGDKIGAQAVINRDKMDNGGEREAYGSKAGGMGDVELLCDPAPIEIGNYVWMDINQNGIQDPSEPPLTNIPVTLSCDGTQIGTAITDANGHYYFGGLSNVNLTGNNTIQAGQSCTLSIAQADVNGKPPTETDPNSNADDVRDNDAVANGSNNEITFTTTAFNDHSLDFGIQPALGCVTGILFEDVNGDGTQNGTDNTAPAGIKLTATDAYGNTYTTVTDEYGNFTFTDIPVGNITIKVDTTDTDIPEGAQWSNYTATINLSESDPSGSPASCTENNFPYTLPAPVDQDPKDVAICANPTSITWDGANVSTKTKWEKPALNTPQTLTTAGGNTVGVTMQIINDNNGEYNQNSSGTSAAFGQPYLTLYLGDQNSPGSGNWDDAGNCAANGYDLEAGESYQLEVTFSEPVILDNWRIRDVDSGDERNGENNWNWQDGIKAEAFDENDNPVTIEKKIGSSGAGLIVDSNDIVHTDPDTYNGGDVATGQGTTPNATNGHIVLTSNFKSIKKLVITHLAGPDVPCQTRSALAMAGLAVCKPLKISGKVFDDANGVSPSATCASSDNRVNGTPTGEVEGESLQVCLLDTNGIVVDTKQVSGTQTVPGEYEFANGIHPNTTYKVLLTTQDCTIGQAAPSAKLPQEWHYEGEQIDPANNIGHDGIPDGMIEVAVASSDISDVDFAINESPEASDYIEQSRSNPNPNEIDFAPNANSTYIDDFENSACSADTIVITNISNGTLTYNGNAISVGDTIDNVDFTRFKITPDSGDVTATFNYKALDCACRESNQALFKAPFVNTGNWSGNVSEDTNNDDAGDQPIEGVTIELYSDPNCDGNRSDGSVVDTTTTDSNGDYQFTGIPQGCYVAVEIQPSGYLDVTQDEGGSDDDQNGASTLNEISGTVNPGEDDNQNDFVEEKPGNLCGNVSEDTNNDDIGEQPIPGVTLTLYNTDNMAIRTTTTDSNGDYCFNDLVPGYYSVKETQPNGYLDVTENEGGTDGDAYESDDNTLGAVVDAGETDTHNDFIEEKPGSLCGYVGEDINNDNKPDRPIPNVTLILYRDAHTIAGTTKTDSSGNYCFNNLAPGSYLVKEVQPGSYVDVSEDEGGEDDDATAPALNTLSAIVNPGEKDKGNNFVERKNSGKITGTVKAVDNNGKYSPIPNVTLVLYNEQGEEVARTKTDKNGNYSFTAPPGNYYIQEQQPDDYYSVSEDEGGADDDAVHSLLNTISVKLGVTEVDIKNDFVEKKVDPYTCSVCAPKICNSCAPKAVTFTSDGTAVVKWKPTLNSVNYEIYLNGKFVASVDKDTREYRFKNLTSDTQYTVKVVAVGKKGGTLPQTFTFKTPSAGTAWMPALYYIMLP